MKPDGFDKAIIGYEPYSQRLVYDRDEMIMIAVEDMEMDYQDAIEYLEYNVWGSYVGEQTPIYIKVGKYEEIVDDLD